MLDRRHHIAVAGEGTAQRGVLMAGFAHAMREEDDGKAGAEIMSHYISENTVSKLHNDSEKLETGAGTNEVVEFMRIRKQKCDLL